MGQSGNERETHATQKRRVRRRLWPPIVILIALSVAYFAIPKDFEQLALFALVAVTVVYAFFTHEQAEASRRMAEEMKLAREMQTTPSIIAYFDNPRSTLLDLVVKNIGLGVAKDVRLEIKPPLHDHRERDIAELSLFKKGIAFFHPGAEFHQIVGVSKSFFGEGSQRSLEYNLKISCSDVFGNPVPAQIIPLDLSVYRDLPIHRESDIDILAKEVKNLAKKFEALKP